MDRDRAEMSSTTTLGAVASLVSRVLDSLIAHDYTPERSDTEYTARRPAHDDNGSSLTVDVTASGLVRVNCRQRCGVNVILSRLGLEFEDLYTGRYP
jgi:hypothetical protein